MKIKIKQHKNINRALAFLGEWPTDDERYPELREAEC